MPRLRNLGLGSPEAYSVMATATDYLPEAIGALHPAAPAVGRLPADREREDVADVADRPARPARRRRWTRSSTPSSGSTPTRLIAHGRFLQEKFGHASTGRDLDLGDQPPAATAQHAWTCHELRSSDLEADLRAAYSSALERIATLRSAQDGIRSAEPGAVNPLDLEPARPAARPARSPASVRRAASGSRRSEP